MEPEVQPTTTPKDDIWRFFAELIKTFLIVLVVVYSLRLFVVQPFIVEGSSMFPRFHNNDYLLVDKLTYRFETPKRGDIIVFRYPGDLSVNYVKRIIGFPGETVRIEGGKVSIINAANPSGLSLNEPYINGGAETLVNNSEVRRDFIVPDDEYFVLGDNRPASSDSREWSFLPKQDIIGRVVIQAYPFDRVHLVETPSY